MKKQNNLQNCIFIKEELIKKLYKHYSNEDVNIFEIKGILYDVMEVFSK